LIEDAMGKFIASLVDVKRADKVPAELQPYLEFKANYEKRSLRGDEMVAIFNIASTTSYLPVFLDPGKTMEEIEEEIASQGFAKLNPASRAALSKYLE
jgi:hypothetical protein